MTFMSKNRPVQNSPGPFAICWTLLVPTFSYFCIAVVCVSVGLDSAADSWIHSLAPAWTCLSVQGHLLSSFILAVPDIRGSSTALCCGGYLAWAWPLGSFNGGIKKPFSGDPTHFDVQIAQLHGGHFSTLFSALLLLFRTCNLASANPVKPSFFPQKAPSQGILAASRLNFCFPVPPSEFEYKLSGHTLYHIHGI